MVDKAKKLADKTYELTDFIVNVLGVEDVGATLHTKATLHTSCHMTRLLGVREEPMKLLSHVKACSLQSFRANITAADSEERSPSRWRRFLSRWSMKKSNVWRKREQRC